MMLKLMWWVLSKVTILDMEYDEEIEYYIVGSAEANPSQFKISNESPVGRALMGQKKGTVVDVVVPDGIVKYKIINIKK